MHDKTPCKKSWRRGVFGTAFQMASCCAKESESPEETPEAWAMGAKRHCDCHPVRTRHSRVCSTNGCRKQTSFNMSFYSKARKESKVKWIRTSLAFGRCRLSPSLPVKCCMMLALSFPAVFWLV